MIRRPPRSTPKTSSAASDVYKRQVSNTGPSGLVQDDGKIIKLLDYDVDRNEIVFPNFLSEKTFYTKFGNKPILFLFIFFMGLNIFWKIN